VPELPNRTELDAALSAVLATELTAQRARLTTLLGEPPDTSRVPPAYWSQLSIAIHARLLPELEAAFMSAARQHAGQLYGLPGDGSNGETGDSSTTLDESELAAAALTWATAHVEDLSKRFIANTQVTLSEKLKTFHEQENKRAAEIAALLLLLDDDKGSKQKRHDELIGIGVPSEPPISAEDYAEKLNDAQEARRDYQGRYMDYPFGSSRAEAIAVNGHTSATTAGERHVNGPYTERTGVKLVAIWKNDMRVGHNICPICRALDGLPEDQWPIEFKAGPPSPHPNCACSVVYEPAADWADFQMTESHAALIEAALTWMKSPAYQVHLLELAA
jgi:hypothetical protein